MGGTVTSSRAATLLTAAIISVAAGAVIYVLITAVTMETGGGIAFDLIKEAEANGGTAAMASADERYCLLGEEHLVHVGDSFEGSRVRRIESRETDGVWFLFRQRADDPEAAEIFTVHQDALRWNAYPDGRLRARFCPESIRIESRDGIPTIVELSAVRSAPFPLP